MRNRLNREFVFKAIIVIISIVVCDLLLGYVFSISKTSVLSLRKLDTYYNHGFEKNQAGTLTYGTLAPFICTNSLGLKDSRVREVPLESSKHRILFIGDSFTEGVGYPYDSTFCGFLAHKLDTSRTEILNSGIAGYSPILYYSRLDWLFNHEHLKVDEVYVFLDYSDISDELAYEGFVSRVPKKWDAAMYAVKKFFYTHSIIYHACEEFMVDNYEKKNNLTPDVRYLYWLRGNDLFNKETDFNFPGFRAYWINASDDFNDATHNNNWYNKPVTQKAIGLVKENMRKIFALCNEKNIKVHLVVYPISSFLDPRYCCTYSLQKHYVALFKDFADSNQVNFIDLFPLFTGNAFEATYNMHECYIPGDSHWSATGHAKVADSLFTLINEEKK